jgi:outer membrane protein OmpA-like peptidoglycan-associated protein
VTLTVTTVSGRVGTALTLATSGDPNGGSLNYTVRNGTATGCAISGSALRAASAGSCVVVATKSANGSYPAVSSPPTVITFLGKATVARPTSVTIEFSGAGSTLSAAGERILSDLARKLKSSDVVTCTGYAKSNSGLALRRASIVARFLTSRVKVHVELKTETGTLANKVIASVK